MAFELLTSLEMNRDRLLKNQFDQLVRGRLQIQAGEKQNPLEKEKSNLIFILDSSGSMDEQYYQTGKTKRQIVFEAVNTLIDQIDNKDTVSIISFNTQAILHADHILGGAKSRIKQALANYNNDSGATNFEVAMKLAFSICKNRSGENHKCIFLTDGISVSGNDATALNYCKQLADIGVTVDSMGIGGDFKFDFMKQFSDLSGSKTENIIQPNQAISVFKNIYSNSNNVFLKKVFINIHIENKFRDIHFYMHYPEQKNLHKFIRKDKNGTLIQINAGDIEQQSFKEYLFDFVIDTPNTASVKIGDCIITYDCPSENLKNQQDKQSIYLNFSDFKNDEIQDGSIDEAFEDIKIMQLEEDLFKLLSQNKHKEAAIKLEKMAEMATNIGDYDKAKVYREQKNKIMRGENLSQADLNITQYTSSRASVVSRIVSRKADDQSVLF